MLLEPIMRVEVVAPTECLGDVVGNLSSRRGQIQSQEDRCLNQSGTTSRTDLKSALSDDVATGKHHV